MLDAFNGELLNTCVGHANASGAPLEACFSPDAAYVVSGSEDGKVWRWHTLPPKLGEREPAALLGHQAVVGAVKCNPTRMMVASACTAVCLWLPVGM